MNPIAEKITQLSKTEDTLLGITVCLEAAAEIERLELLVETLKTEHAGWTYRLALEAKIERLEAELAIINGPDDTGDDSLFNVRRLRADMARLKAALENKEGA